MEGFVHTLSLPSQVNVQVWYLCFLVCVNAFKSRTNCCHFSCTESSRQTSETENKGSEVREISGASALLRQFKAERTTCRLLSEVLVYERVSFVVSMCRNLTLAAMQNRGDKLQVYGTSTLVATWSLWTFHEQLSGLGVCTMSHRLSSRSVPGSDSGVFLVQTRRSELTSSRVF